MAVPHREQQAAPPYQSRGQRCVEGLGTRSGFGRKFGNGDTRVAQHATQHGESVRREVVRIAIERHRQDGVDADAKAQCRLRDQQVRPFGHSDDDAKLGVRQESFQFGDERRHGALHAGDSIGVQIPMAGYAYDERVVARGVLIAHGCCAGPPGAF